MIFSGLITTAVRFAAMRSYDRDGARILEESRAEYRRRQARGYSREEAFSDLEDVLTEVEQHSHTVPPFFTAEARS